MSGTRRVISVSRIFGALLLVLAMAPTLVSAQSAHETPVETVSFDNFEGLEEAHAAYLENTTLQLERPEDPPEPIEPPPPPPNWLRGLFDFLGIFAPVFNVLFYVIIAGIAAGIVYFIVTEVIRLRFGGAETEDSTQEHVIQGYRVDANLARKLLEEADLLAQQGKFAEAVHLLLFRSIEDIQERLEGGVPRSLTAREIGNMHRLPDAARRALKPIITIVERSFFGAQSVDSSSWEAARAHYEEFAFGTGWAKA